MAVNFPDNPSNGDTTVVNGVTYTYNATNNLWKAGSSSSSGGGGGTTTYATAAELPQTATNGDLALVEETDKLYIWNNTAWYNIALINTAPNITQGGAGSYTLATDGTPTVITLTATDPESIPVTWSYAVTSGSLTNGGGTTATVTQADNVFTITPTTTEAYAGEFTLTFSVTDGANIVNDVNSFSLNFVTIVEDSKYTVALITTDGSVGTNSTFIDSSSNALTVTSAGTPSLQSFSPYRPGGYSTYFDGTGDYLRIPYDASFSYNSSTPLTIDMWFHPLVSGTDAQHIASSNNGNSGDAGLNWLFRQKADNTLRFVMIDQSGTVVTCDSSDLMNINEWNHVSVVMTGSSIKHWLNGSFQQEVSFTGSMQVNGNIDVGAWGTTYFNGYITDFRYNVGEEIYTGTADINVPTERLTTNSYTKALACHLPYNADGSSINSTITIYGNTSVKPYSPYDYDFYNTTDHGGSIYMDGSGDYLAVTHNGNFNFGTGDFTIDFWYYPTAHKNWSELFDTRNSEYTAGGLAIYTNATGTIFVYSSDGSSGSNNISGPILILNHWSHIEVSRSSGVTKLFVNGKQLVGSYTDGNNYTGPSTTPYIGSDQSTQYTTTGYISDFRILNGTAAHTANFTPPTKLVSSSGSAVHVIGNNADILDKSQSNTLTLVGNTTASTTQTKYASSSIYFDGAGDSLELSKDVDLDVFNFGTVDWTVEFWAYPTEVTGAKTIFSFLRAGPNEAAPYLYSDGTTIKYYVSGTDQINSGVGIFQLTTWRHIAVVRNGNDHKLFVDGIQMGSTWTNSVSYTQGRPVFGDYYTSLGTLHNSSLFHGYIEDFRIIKGLARYTSNFTPPTGSLEG